MDVGEALDREVIVERAEELRIWLAGLGLSKRAMSALDRELSGIIANDPGGYINGARPLAGMTSDAFVDELQRPSAGAVGRVRSVGDSVIAELRAALGASDNGAAPEPPPPAEPEPAEAPKPARRRARRAARPEPVEEAAEAAPAPAEEAVAEAAEVPPAPAEAPADEAQAEAPPRRRGRPRGSKSAPKADGEAGAPRRRGRPRATPAPADGAMAPASEAAPAVAAAASGYGDPLLDQLARLWPMLHPQARRAIVLYTGTLLIEGM